mmetsp:Transcript_5290/g.9479  ORF Transcript_5290/g.9479 Transcript_5290/m.9479 type:complete len:84 (+) Transcript_5290:187-438(+)
MKKQKYTNKHQNMRSPSPLAPIAPPPDANSSTTRCNDEPVLVQKRDEIVKMSYGSNVTRPKMRQKIHQQRNANSDSAHAQSLT